MPNYDFTYNSEIGQDSLKPHHPSPESGVTIGPGYDMGKRTGEQVKNDLKKAGITYNVLIERISTGAGLNDDGSIKKDFDHQSWTNDNQDIQITEEQQKRLFDNVLINEYEQRVKVALRKRAAGKSEYEQKLYKWENLNDEQKQMLFDFEYNPGLSEFPNLTDGIVYKDRKKVEENYKRYATFKKGGKKVKLPLGRNKEFEKHFLTNSPSANNGNSGSQNTQITPLKNPLTSPITAQTKLSELPIPEMTPSLPGFSIGFPAARLTDLHICPMIDPIFKPHFGGPIKGPGIPTVIIGGLVAATFGDMCSCFGPPDSIIKGSKSVLIGSKMAARMFDNCAHGGMIVMGCPTVLIGDTPSPATVAGMQGAASGASFLDICNK